MNELDRTIKTSDIRRLRVVDGHLHRIGRWNLIGRIVRYFRGGEKDKEVTNCVKNLLQAEH